MRRFVILVLTLMLPAASNAEAQTLYGFERVHVAPVVFKSRLVAYDIQNHTIIGHSNFPVMQDYLESGAFDSKSNTLYGWETDSDSLCTVDITTGILKKIGGSGALPEDGGISCLAINPITDEMFAMSWPGYLYKVDKANGNRNYIGRVSTGEHAHGLAFSPNGILYCSDTTYGSQLFTINTETTEASLVAGVGGLLVISLDFDKNGILYGTDVNSGHLVTIDITSGLWSNVGYVGPVAGMAFGPIPEPATLLLFGLGALAIRRKK